MLWHYTTGLSPAGDLLHNYRHPLNFTWTVISTCWFKAVCHDLSNPSDMQADYTTSVQIVCASVY